MCSCLASPQRSKYGGEGNDNSRNFFECHSHRTIFALGDKSLVGDILKGQLRRLWNSILLYIMYDQVQLLFWILSKRQNDFFCSIEVAARSRVLAGTRLCGTWLCDWNGFCSSWSPGYRTYGSLTCFEIRSAAKYLYIIIENWEELEKLFAWTRSNQSGSAIVWCMSRRCWRPFVQHCWLLKLSMLRNTGYRSMYQGDRN